MSGQHVGDLPHGGVYHCFACRIELRSSSKPGRLPNFVGLGRDLCWLHLLGAYDRDHTRFHHLRDLANKVDVKETVLEARKVERCSVPHCNNGWDDATPRAFYQSNTERRPRS